MLQCVFSVFMQCFWGGVLFVKLSIPTVRTETIIFSEKVNFSTSKFYSLVNYYLFKKALIAPRDNIYYLMIRIGDLRISNIIIAKIRMYLVIFRPRTTPEGECLPFEMKELFVNSLSKTNMLLFMPSIVTHKIDKKSPLFQMISSDKFKANFNFEIIATLEGK